MKRRKLLGLGPVGYTIVEVMIFLIVSGALLLSAGSLISGRQEKTRFMDGVNDISLNLQDVLNDVSTGIYPSNNQITCTFSGSDIRISTGARTQGTNTGCIFSGKLVYFPSNEAAYRVYTLVSNQNASDFRSSDTELVGIGGNQGLFDNRTNLVDIRNPRVIQKNADGTAGPEYKALLVVSEFGRDTGSVVSGNATKVQLFGYTGEITNEEIDIRTTSTLLRAIPNDAQVVVCLEQPGDSSRVASVYITPQLTTELVAGQKDPLCEV